MVRYPCIMEPINQRFPRLVIEYNIISSEITRCNGMYESHRSKVLNGDSNFGKYVIRKITKLFDTASDVVLGKPRIFFRYQS